MTKNVKIFVEGISEADGNGEPIKTCTEGAFYEKDCFSYIAYDDSPDGEAIVKTLVKFSESYLEITRKGAYNARLIFEEGKEHLSDYNTPFGTFKILTDTRKLSIKKQDNLIEISALYFEEMNGEKLGRCKLKMKIESM